MQSIAIQRQAFRTLQYQGHLATDGIFAGLPDAWEAIVLKHAVKGKDGTLRITPAAKAKILAECDAALAALDVPIAAMLGAAVKRATALPREAVT